MKKRYIAPVLCNEELIPTESMAFEQLESDVDIPMDDDEEE